MYYVNKVCEGIIAICTIVVVICAFASVRCLLNSLSSEEFTRIIGKGEFIQYGSVVALGAIPSLLYYMKYQKEENTHEVAFSLIFIIEVLIIVFVTIPMGKDYIIEKAIDFANPEISYTDEVYWAHNGRTFHCDYDCDELSFARHIGTVKEAKADGAATFCPDCFDQWTDEQLSYFDGSLSDSEIHYIWEQIGY